jgi:hypothetical protein
LHANRIVKETTVADLKAFAAAEPVKSINATKEHKGEITAALAAMLEAGIKVPDDAKPFDSEFGQVATEFCGYLKPSHLMAICDVKMKQTFSQSAFVSPSCAAQM